MLLKKIFLISTIIVASSSIAFAGTPYVGGSLGITNLDGIGHIGTIGTLFGGYGSTFGQNKNIYLGGELNIDLAHYSNFRTNYGIGASFIPGVMLTKYTMAYARIGIEAGRYSNGPTNSLATRVGDQIGLGLQTNLTKNWDVRGEYSNHGPNFGLVYKFD